MTDEVKLNAAVSRQARAESLLRDELVIEAFDTVTRAYIDAWANSNVSDQDKRERLWHAVQTVAKVKSHLKTAIDNGKLAQKEIDEVLARERRGRIAVV